MKKTNLYYNNYLSDCDLINKYNYKSRYNIFNIKSIIFEFPIIQINNLLNRSLNSKYSNLKSYFIFYILFFFKPYINYKLVKSQDKNYSLKFQISNINQIQNFIHIFFLNFFSNKFFKFFFNVKDLNLNNLFISEKIQNNVYQNFLAPSRSTSINKIKLTTRSLIFKIPIFCFYGLDFYTINIFENINLKDLFFYINIVIDSPQIFTTETLKNLPCFWIFNSYKKKQ